jgi:hypothetical protein
MIAPTLPGLCLLGFIFVLIVDANEAADLMAQALLGNRLRYTETP